MENTGSKKTTRRRRAFTSEFKAEIVELCQRGDRSVGHAEFGSTVDESPEGKCSGDMMAPDRQGSLHPLPAPASPDTWSGSSSTPLIWHVAGYLVGRLVGGVGIASATSSAASQVTSSAGSSDAPSVSAPVSSSAS